LRSADVWAPILPPSTNVPKPVSELIGRDLEPNEILDLSAFRLSPWSVPGASARRASALKSPGV